MAIRAVIFDVSGTLVERNGQAVPGVIALIQRLQELDIQVVAVSNESPSWVRSQLQRSGIPISQVLTKYDVGKSKGSDLWIEPLKRITGLEVNSLLYVGDSDYDMFTASRGPMIYVHAGWAEPNSRYGFVAPSPSWVQAAVEHIFQKQQLWYWTLDTNDQLYRPVRARAVINGSGEGDLKYDIIEVFKKDRGLGEVGPMSLRDFILLHMVASICAEGWHLGSDLWTTYPGHDHSQSPAMQSFLAVTAKLFRQKYEAGLVERHTAALSSREANKQSLKTAFNNQLDTVRINPPKGGLAGKHVILFDDFITRGPSVETARNLLLQAGAGGVLAVGIGKYGSAINVLSQAGAADPELRLDLTTGTTNQAALNEFIASYEQVRAMR